MKTTIFTLLASLFFTMIIGCERTDPYSIDQRHQLSFSVDTLSFDTIFSTVGSSTMQFIIYNKNKENLRIESIQLATPHNSGFRINVDGRKGSSFQNIDIWKEDSLYLLVEVTLEYNNASTPLLMEDSVIFITNGIRQSVLLQAYGQNARIFKKGLTITEDTTLNAELPYLIHDSLFIAEGVTLTIEEGTLFYMHPGAKVVVNGRMVAKGSMERPILFRGDRMGALQADISLPFDHIPGQWNGCFFASSSFNNELEYIIVRNSLSGFIFEPSTPDQLKMQLNQSQITNISGTLLQATNCHIEITNSELTNAGESVVRLIGGKYQFTHCTIANYIALENRTAPCLTLSDILRTEERETPYPLSEASFHNCIIDGSFSSDSTTLYRGELSFDTKESEHVTGSATFNYHFNSCVIRTAIVEKDRFNQCLFIKNPTYIKKGNKENFYTYDFRLANESVGIGGADKKIAEKHPIDRYGVQRVNNTTGPSIGAYEYVYQEEEKKEEKKTN